MAEQDVEQKKRDIPLWLGLGLVVLGLAGAGWFIWFPAGFWTGNTGVFTIEGASPNNTATVRSPRQLRNMPPLRAAQKIRQFNENNWRVRSGVTSMTVRKSSDDKLNITTTVFALKILPAEAQWVLVARNRLDKAAIKQIDLTDDQVKQFKTLPTSPVFTVNPSPDQLKQMQDAFKKYIAATGTEKDAAERAVMTLAEQIGIQLLPGLQQQIQAEYDTVKNLVTQEKWDKLKALGISPLLLPATTPAPAPYSRP